MRKIRRTLPGFIFVLLHWREFHDIVLTLHQPWFDVVEGSDMLYLSDPANWRCKFCGCRYRTSVIVLTARGLEEPQQKHAPGCLWPRIEKIHPYYR